MASSYQYGILPPEGINAKRDYYLLMASMAQNQNTLIRERGIKLFLNLHSSVQHIKFNSLWCNQYTYLPGAAYGVYAPSMKPGDIAAFTDDYQRRGIIIGTTGGNVVIYEQFTPSLGGFGDELLVEMTYDLSELFKEVVNFRPDTLLSICGDQTVFEQFLRKLQQSLYQLKLQ